MKVRHIIIALLPVCIACTPKPQTKEKSIRVKDSSSVDAARQEPHRSTGIL